MSTSPSDLPTLEATLFALSRAAGDPRLESYLIWSGSFLREVRVTLARHQANGDLPEVNLAEPPGVDLPKALDLLVFSGKLKRAQSSLREIQKQAFAFPERKRLLYAYSWLSKARIRATALMGEELAAYEVTSNVGEIRQ